MTLKSLFDGGGCVGRFPIATNEVYTNKTSGEKVTNTDWHNVVLRNKAAEICEKYLSKGDKIYVEGRLKTRKWQDQDKKIDILLRSTLMNSPSLVPKKSIGWNQPTNINPPAEEVNPSEDDLPF